MAYDQAKREREKVERKQELCSGTVLLEEDEGHKEPRGSGNLIGIAEWSVTSQKQHSKGSV